MLFSLRHLALATAFMLPLPALADGDAWVGFYQAIDPEDGSTNHMSIVPKGDGTYILQVAVSEHVRCDAPAVFIADARPEGDNLIRKNTMLRCEGKDPIEHSDATYSLNEDHGIISLSAPFDGRTLFYHRISSF